MSYFAVPVMEDGVKRNVLGPLLSNYSDVEEK